MATISGSLITLDDNFADWPANDMIMTAANTVANYQVYGAFVPNATLTNTGASLGNAYVIGIDATSTTDPVIAPGTVIYLNTDQNDTTGFSPSFASGAVGAEYEVQFALDSNNVLQAYLYSVNSAGVTTEVSATPLPSLFSSNGESVELAIPQSLLTPSGGTAPTAINFDALINNSTGLPSTFSTGTPEYVIPDPAAAPAPTTIANTITLDGSFTDWPASDVVATPGNTASGYQIYGAFLNNGTATAPVNDYVIGIDATVSTDPVIGAGSTIYLNTDQNTATGYELSFANVGAEYEVQFQYGANSALEPFLYSVTSAGVATEINNDQPLSFGFSSNGESVELAIPQSDLPTNGGAPTSIEFSALINNTAGLPTDLATSPQYQIVDPAALTTVNHDVKKVAIIYSATTAALYDGLNGPQAVTAYDDLFMDAQHQAEAAGVSYDILTEAQLASDSPATLAQYSALIFPDFQDVQSSQVSTIANTLYQAVYDYHVPIITAGDFMTNDQTGAALPGNSYANMQNLLGLTNGQFATGATYSVSPDSTALTNNNPILAGYTSGQTIGGASGEFASIGQPAGLYSNTGYTSFIGYNTTPTSIADINITTPGAVTNPTGGAASTTVAGVEQTTTGGTNTEFATAGLFGDSNLLQQVIQNTVFGTTPSLAMDITRFKGVLNSRTDMDQSQFPDDVGTTGYTVGGTGIYDAMIPILQSLEQQYDFVGSYYINIGDDADPANNNSTNWAVSDTYYDQLLEMGNEIGDHSYTHLIDPSQPLTPVTATTSTAASTGATQITVSTLPSYNGATIGMIVSDPGNAAAVGAGTIISGYTANSDGTYTLNLLYDPSGVIGQNLGLVSGIGANTQLSFAVPTENTNFLSTGAKDTTGTNPNFTYGYEFGQSKAIEGSNIGITIAGAAVPGANDLASTADNIEQYFQTASLPDGLTGYVTGGWTGVGSGSPNAFGYIDPSDTGSVYIAPNITFDFSEIQFDDKTPESALSDWENLFNELSGNSDSPVIVWPWHDYGITDWPTNGPGTTPPDYNVSLYQDFIAYAYNAGYEFVTTEDLAQRVAAEQAATITESTNGNMITATVTPGTSGGDADLGAMAINVVNGAAGQVIENAGSWYAYDTNSVFLANDTAKTAENFTVTLGTTQDDVTHVDSLPMRADLQSVSGDGTNLTFAITGDGTVDIHIKTPGSGTNIISVTTTATGTGAGTPTATLTGDDLQLTFNDGPLAFNTTSPEGIPVLHNVTINEGPTAVAGATFVFGIAPPVIAGTHPTTTAADAAVNPFAAPPGGVGVTITDPNAGAMDALTITLSNSANGVLSGTGLTAGTTAGSYVLSAAAPATLTSELDALTFTPTKGAPGSITTTTFTLSDQSSVYPAAVIDSATTVTDTDASPTIAGTHATTTLSEAAVNPFAAPPGGVGVTITDPNAGATDTLTITLSNSANGVLSGTGLTAGTTAGSYVLSAAAPATLTSELDALTFTPAKGAPGSSTVTTFTLSDQSSVYPAAVTDSATTVTDTDPGVAPTIAGTHATTTTNDAGVHLFTGVTIGDLNANATDMLTITLSNGGTTGKLTGTGLSGGTNGVYTLKDVATTVTSELDLLTFTPVKGATGSTTVTTFTLSDLSSGFATPVTDSATTVTDIDAKVAPTIMGTHATTTLSDAAVTPFTGVTITDVNSGATDTLTITLSKAANGKLTGTGLGGGTNGVYTLKGSAATVTSELDGLTFTPAKGTPGSTTATTFALSDQSTGFATPVTDSATVVTDTDPLAAPTIVGTHATATTNDAAVNPFTGVTIGDLNPGATETLTITLSGGGTTGVLSGRGLSGGTGGVYTVSGTAAAVTSALDILSFKPATGAAGSTTTTTFTLSDLSSKNSTAVSDGATTVTDTDAGTGALAITSASYTTSWVLGGTAPVGSTVTVLSGATTLGTVVATTGSWTFTTNQNNSAIRTFTITANGVTSGAYIEGTAGNDTFNFATESALSAAALINGAGGASDRLQLTSAATLSDTDFAHAQAIEILGLTGASSLSLGPNASAAGIATVVTGNGVTSITDTNSKALTVNAAALPGGTMLTLAGSTPYTVTGLQGNLTATGDSGALTVTATGTTAQTIATGSGNTSITDNAAGSVTVDATALGTNTLTLAGTAAKTVNNLTGNVAVSGAATITINATGSGPQSVTTGNGNTTIIDNGGGAMAVNNANAKGSGHTLTLSGTAAETVTFLAQNLVASGLSGSLNVTTAVNGLSITPGTGTNTINAGAMTGTLTLTGPNGATLTAMGGNLNASTDSGTINVTTTGAAQSVTTGSGPTTINDTSTGNLTVNAAALSASNLLTLTGAGTATVTGLKGNLDATGDSGTISVTATGTNQTVNTGSGNMTISDSTSALTVNAAALSAADTLTLSGSTAKTVNGLQGNLSWTSGAGPITVTATGSGPQSITTGTGADTIIAQTSGGDTIHGGGGADSINVTGHTVADSFTYSATTDSRNTTTGHDTIAGFAAGGSINDLLGFSALNSGLSIEGQISSGATVGADSIAWLYSGGNAMVYVNDTAGALATSNTNLMEITLSGLSSGLSTSNFKA
jgi:hypothetical protein